jgi:dienelactone hydrolase
MCDTVQSGVAAMVWKTIGAIGASAVVVAMVSTTSTRAAVGGPALTPVPCRDALWQNDDPTFEALPKAKASFGQYGGGIYRIEIPDAWNGELVLWAHGFVDQRSSQGQQLRVGFPGGGQAGQGRTFREHLIANGFAWAASSYRCNGYVPGIGLLDTMALGNVFTKTNEGKAAARTYLTGASMGGHMTVLGLQEFPTAFDGGLAMCPSGPGEKDFLTAVGAASERVSGVTVADATRDRDVTALLQVVGTPPQYTEKGRQLARIQIEISGGPRPFALEGLTGRFTQNVSAAATVFTEPAWNRAARDTNGQYEETIPFDGRIERPLMTLHGTGDLFVPISLEQTLKRAVDAAGKSERLVQRIIRVAGHCGFSRSEQARAFDDLVTWVHHGAHPEGDDVLGNLSDAGLTFTDPLRPGDPGTIRP